MRLVPALLLLVGLASPAVAQPTWSGPSTLDINKVEIGSHPAYLTFFGETLYFRAQDGGSRLRLYQSSGERGAYDLVDLPPPFQEWAPRPDGVLGDRLMVTTGYVVSVVSSLPGEIVPAPPGALSNKGPFSGTPCPRSKCICALDSTTSRI